MSKVRRFLFESNHMLTETVVTEVSGGWYVCHYVRHLSAGAHVHSAYIPDSLGTADPSGFALAGEKEI